MIIQDSRNHATAHSNRTYRNNNIHKAATGWGLVEGRKAYEEQKRNYEELKNQRASNGMTFEEAFEIVADFKMQHAKKIALLMTINPPKFDPYKLEGRDKEKYFEAQKALEEIKAKFPEEYSKATSFRF